MKKIYIQNIILKPKLLACGAVFEVGSTMPEIKWKFAVNVILYTGNEKVMDTCWTRRTFPISVEPLLLL